MYASVEKLSGYITRGVYTVSGPFHPFGGAVDIIVVQQQDGSFKSSPWYVRFGKFQGVLKTKEKVVTIAVNGEDADFHMYLDHKGEAYFLRDVADEGGSGSGGDSESPPSTSGDETDDKSSKSQSQISKTQSCHIDGDVAVIGDQVVVARRRSGIFGLFGRRSMKEDHTGVHRVSSLERAEIAADLLETKWSTNLPTADPRGESEGEHFEELSVHGSPSEEIQDVSSLDGNALGEDLGSSVISEVHIDPMGEDLGSSVISEVRMEERIMESEGGRRLEEVIEITTFDNGELSESGVVYETVMTESKEFEVSPEGPILKNATFNVTSHGSPKSVDSEQAFHESFDASVVEKGGKEVFTLSYSVPAEGSNVKFNLSTDNGEESLNLPFCPSEQFDHGDKVSSETSDLISKVESQPELSRHEDEDVDACGQLSLEISTTEDAVRNQANWLSNEAFEDAITNDLSYDTPIIGSGDKLIGSCPSYNSNMISSESEVPNHEEETLNPADGKEPSLESIVLHGNQPQMNGSGSESVQPQHPDSSEFPDSSDQVQEITNLEKGFEGESSSIPDGDDYAQKADNTSCSVETIKARVQSSENSDDDQFLFGDFDGIEAKGANTKQSLHDLAVKADDDTLFNSEGDAEECETKSVHGEQSRENIYEVLRAQTSPMAIPRSQAESEFVIRSLPIIRSHIHELGPSNHLHPLSCSLNMNSDRNEHGLHDHTSESSTPEVDSKTSMLLGRHISTSAPDLDPDKWGDQRGAPVNPAVELSLCRHLLFEGMGADSASQAFDAEKVNLEKFSALRSSIVTNKRLVVRIGDRYFPWDAAAPIILGMISFGQGEIFEPQGMIAVDRPGNILKDDAMGEMVPSGGSWRLWPFTFRKSKTITTVRATREGIIVADVDTTPESSKNYTGNAEAPKSKTAKKKEQTLIPTSEELASLNLKEGPNVITFTFSTAMLGRQQVDARIFLWKWNTRIVISDVDGTITKSDVLGQFMPMVGIDWSQTGVAHLFSAIKENGYQLLFLSARAISQAYITRQFLVNLKQDGKALPDGPVVISPDGLFPSLYREVIRRAPHEFKISCLEDIKALFPSDCSPFYAGFGNRDTDEVSYLKVGIPRGKIFIINPKGQVAVNRRVATKSYTSLHALVNGMFPPMSSAEQEDFNSWNYWKLPLPDIDV